MSAIGSSGFIPQVNPYAGNISSTKDSDAARGDSAGRAVEGSQAQSAQSLNEAGETERSSDRDADGFYTPGGSEDEGSSAEQQNRSASDDSQKNDSPETASRLPLDDHRGNLITFDV